MDAPSIALLLVGVLVAAALLVWAVEIRTPRRIRWSAATLAGSGAASAPGLVLQHAEGTTVWATRAYSIYRSSDGGPFERVARVRPAWGEAWGGYLRSLRRTFGYQELVELWPLDDDRLVVFAGGHVHRLDLRAGTRERGFELRYFGRGRGRGLMAFGLDRTADGTFYFAEYVTESGNRPTGVWRSRDDGATWQLAYEFDAGTVRHIHAVHGDPRDGSVWIGTGDRDEHSFVGRSTDGGDSYEWVGRDAQLYRTCAFASFDASVIWAMDADFEQNHVLAWDRATQTVTTGSELPDVTYYARRQDDQHALLGLAQGVAEVWVADAQARAVPWLSFPVTGVPPNRGPSPGVRLARGTGGDDVYVNPLRTIDHESTIFRLAARDMPRPDAAAGA
ncbi:MAG: hypothetical protein JWM25_1934 [Thermoleophilia bacterium]|nr:hypothetical protein [Thermoleophilia bacterium]